MNFKKVSSARPHLSLLPFSQMLGDKFLNFHFPMGSAVNLDGLVKIRNFPILNIDRIFTSLNNWQFLNPLIHVKRTFYMAINLMALRARAKITSHFRIPSSGHLRPIGKSQNSRNRPAITVVMRFPIGRI